MDTSTIVVSIVLGVAAGVALTVVQIGLVALAYALGRRRGHRIASKQADDERRGVSPASPYGRFESDK